MRLARFGPAHVRIAIFALASALNFYAIDRTSLWNDEAFSFFAAQGGVVHALSFIADDTQPPFYYLLLSLWLGLGSSVFVIRALSATAMTLALLPLHASARLLFGSRVALLASFLFAIAPLNVSWAQRARPYPVQALLVALAFWGFVQVFLSADARQRILGSGVRQAFRQRSFRPAVIDLAWLTYAVCGALAMLAQDPAGFFILGCNVAIGLAIIRDLPRNRVLLINWVLAQLLLILIWLLWLPMLVAQISTHLLPIQIASKHAGFLIDFSTVVGTLRGLFSIAAIWRLTAFFVPVYAGVAGYAVYQMIRRRPAVSPVFLAAIVTPIAACVVGFFAIHPVFGYVIYTFIWMLVPYTILISFGIMAIPVMPLRLGVLGIIVAGNFWGLRNVYESETPPLAKVAQLIRANLLPGDGIILSDKYSGRWGIAYYLGSPYGASVAGLNVVQWDPGALAHSVADVASWRSAWVIVPDGEVPAVDLGPLRQHLQVMLTESIGPFQISHLNVCPAPERTGTDRAGRDCR